MSAYGVVLDPPAVITGRTQLDLNDGAIGVGGPSSGTAIDWGDAAVKQYLAEQQYGEGAVSFRVPNRVITIPLLIGAEGTSTVAEEEEARRKLNGKVALLQRQGGVLLRQRPGHEPLYADIMNATLTLPDVYGETGGVEPNTVLKLEVLPDFYGEEITLDAIEQTGQVVAVLQESAAQAVIKGDYPARTRIVLSEKAKHDQKGALWGLRSTFFDAAASAALFFDAKDMTPINGASVVVSGGTFSGEGMELAEPEAGIWHPFMTTDLAAGPTQLSHIGSYRIVARVWAEATDQQMRLAWSTDDATVSTLNAQQSVVGGEEFSIIDLGEIRLQTPPVGEHWWRGVFQVNGSGTPVIVDRVWLQPVDDGAGKLRATAIPTSSLLSPTKPATRAANNGAGTGEWGLLKWALEAGGFCVVSLSGSGLSSPFLQLSHFGFAIPETAIIKGIELVSAAPRIQGKGTASIALQLYKALALAGTAKPGIGGPTDLWGTTWTPAQINATGFGIGVKLSGVSGSITALTPGAVELRVYYSYSASALPEDAVLYSERSSEIRFDGCYREDTTSGAYVRVSEETGDLPRLPPSGLEGRPVELFLKNSRGELDGAGDPGIDAIQAQVIYRPCYIGRI